MTAFVFVALIIVTLFFRSTKISAELLDDNCGLTSHFPRNKRMTGGKDADILSNPWMVLLLGDSVAGGSLINSRLYFDLYIFELYF